MAKAGGSFKAGKLSKSERIAVQEILGYLNFSSGTPDPGFQQNFNRIHARFGLDRSRDELRDFLLSQLQQLEDKSSTFADSDQASAVIRLALDHCLPAYCEHHSDLLFHLEEKDFVQPFFLVRIFEAVLSQGAPWNDTERITQAALDQLNDFLGYRPLAVLENDQKMQPYAHERTRPIPLYIRGAGAAAGKYEELIERTIEFFKNTPEEIPSESHFDLSLMDELAVDMRAHDHMHPVNKRTNYMFGEWDPHVIDSGGRYRRFVIRRMILDALLDWMEQAEGMSKREILYDASAVLCGTMLMASAISGSGPDTHDSSVTLTSLLPKVARQRDAFYSRLLQTATGKRSKRLLREAELTQQPFGHVRQHLNINLSRYGAKQVQYRTLAQLFARMGYFDAAREQAGIIPSPSARFECEIECRLTESERLLDQGNLAEAFACLGEIEDLFHRGIECGAIMDPWNILGFQAQFPMFSSREDAVPDQRAEMLLELMDRTFRVYSRALAEAGAQQNEEKAREISERFFEFASHWDRYATIAVEDLPEVAGIESWESANWVSRALSEWRKAGEAAGDISFWNQHVEHFESAKAYAQVVAALLRKNDHIASMGLLMQWLGQADVVGLESGPHSIFTLLQRWLQLVIELSNEPDSKVQLWTMVRRLFDFLEANAGEFWQTPSLGEFADIPMDMLGDGTGTGGETSGGIENAPDGFEEDEDNLFRAAYDEVTYRDSAEDGHDEEILDGGFFRDENEFELISRYLEPRLKFIRTLAQLWKTAAAAFFSHDSSRSEKGNIVSDSDDKTEHLQLWNTRCHDLQSELMGLLSSVWDCEISVPSGDHDSNVEYDMQLQTKFYVLHTVIATLVSCRDAERCLLCCLPASKAGRELSDGDRQLADVYRAVLSRDVPEVRRLFPKLLMRLSKSPLLYVPFENGGHPAQVQAARSLQSVMRFLLSQLPEMGMLRETWQLLRTAYRMERSSRPGGMAVTEFDRLFRIALKRSLECVIRSSTDSDGEQFADEELIEIVGEIVERYLDVWLKHSDTMRLSSIEGMKHELIWEQVTEFISDYGADLFHARFLTLGNLRTILHSGIDRFLDHLAENQDPLHPMPLLDDLESGKLDREQSVEFLQLIYSSIIDKYDRFLEYNTTTTQSDYGEMFHCLLDFLRVESVYERDSWNLVPARIAHELLSAKGKSDAATIWEKVFEAKTREKADLHLDELDDLEKDYGMRLPSVRDHLGERFIKPMAVNRMQALVPHAIDDIKLHLSTSESFQMLLGEIGEYLESTSGSAIDIPPWLRSLERAVERTETHLSADAESSEVEFQLPSISLSLADIRRQLKSWDQRRQRGQKGSGQAG